MKRIISFLALTSILFPIMAQADVIIPDYKTVGSCVEFSNIGDYSDYVFIAYGEIMMGNYEIIEADDCFGFYKFATPHIYAIKKTDFDQEKIGENSDEKEEYFNNNLDLIKSNVQINSEHTEVEENNPLTGKRGIWKIVSLDNDEFVIEKEKVILRYEDGSTKEEVVNGNNKVVPSSESNWYDWLVDFWYFIIPALGIIITSIVLIKRTRRPNR